MTTFDPADLRIMNRVLGDPLDRKALGNAVLSSAERKLAKAREFLRSRAHLHPNWGIKRREDV